jgi:hypothetical protein
VAPDHRIGFVHQSLALSDAVSQLTLMRLELSRLAVPPLGTVMLVLDDIFLPARLTAETCGRSMLPRWA